jgi:hypothetical protein
LYNKEERATSHVKLWNATIQSPCQTNTVL